MQNLDPAPEPTTITVNQEAQVQCYEFKCLWRTICNNASSDKGWEM